MSNKVPIFACNSKITDMRRLLFTGLGCMLTLSAFPASDTVRLASPNSRIQVSVWYDGNMKYNVLHDGIPRLSASEISMVCREGNLRKALGNIRSVTRTSIDEQIEVPIPENAESSKIAATKWLCVAATVIRFASEPTTTVWPTGLRPGSGIRFWSSARRHGSTCRR